MLNRVRHFVPSVLRVFLRHSAAFSVLLLLGGSFVPAQAQLSFVQGNSSDPQSPQTTVTVPYTLAQTAGDLNVVVVGWNDATAQIKSVTDAKGNVYAVAAAPVVQSGTATQAIYYAKNIAAAAAGANSVTVTFTVAAVYPDIRIAEYSGADPVNPVDVSVGAQGNSGTSSSGAATTTNANDLLVGANLVQSTTTGPGTGFTSRMISNPDGDILEDRVVTATGSYSATAPLTSNPWIMQMVAFRAVSSPIITGLSQPTGAIGVMITITGTNFGASQGSSTVTFNGTAGNVSTWSATSITVPVPAGATTGPLVVTVGGLQSNSVNFTVVPPPNIASISPTSGGLGTPVTITGTNFGAAPGTVTFNGIAGAPTNWGNTSITVPVPNGALTGNIVVTVLGAASNPVLFTVLSPGPSISTLSLPQGPVGASITITGSNFGASQVSGSTVTFNGISANPISWSSASITATVPTAATTGNVIVSVGGVASNPVPFAVVPPPVINTINPTSGTVGTSVTISGSNFGPTVGTRASYVTFNGLQGRTTNWSDTSITLPVPTGATSGNVVVVVGGVSSNGVPFNVLGPPASISATGGTPQSTNINTVFATQLQATVFDASNNPVSGVVVTFTAPTSGASGTFAGGVNTATTNAQGVATAPAFTANGIAGGPYTVAASVSGVATPANFSLTNLPSSVRITLVQHNGMDFGTTSSGTLAFKSNNTAGNWIGVVIRAQFANQVFTITDTRGNTYHQAVAFSESLDGTTLGIFYVENIAAGANSITVSDTLGGVLRFAILEYSGVILANSLDNTIAAVGHSASPNSGNLNTSANGDLLLGAIKSANTATFTAGTGFTIEEFVPVEPNTKLIAEDQIQTSLGTAAAAATLASPDNWSAALAAFKSASAGPPPPISVSISPTTVSLVDGTGMQSFTATLQNDFHQQGVTFSLSGAGCSGSACGTLTNVTATTVTYTAPPSVPNPATVTLTATSVADNTKSASATVTVLLGPITVVVAPKRGSITTSQTQQFTGTVFNDTSNSGVTWQVDGNTGGNTTTGTITAAGLFTPGTQAGLHTITATSVANASANASVSFAVTDLQGVYTHHNDIARTGQNLNEYALTTATVSSSTFSSLFSCQVDGYVYAQPLYVANLLVGATTRNVVFIATEHDSVYAFDADSTSCVQLWKTSFLGSGVTTMSWQDTNFNNPSLPTNDVYPEIGITSTPVIDPASKTIYVEAKTKETVGTGCSTSSPCYVHRLHALDITTGAEKLGGPIVISGPNFSSHNHFNRPALLLANGTVYIGFGSHGDIQPWYGWLFGYDAATLAQKFVFPTSDATGGVSNGGAIWEGGAGPAADASGNIYVATGNGNFDGSKNFGDSVIKLSPTGSRLDYFAPFNQSVFNANDVDLGSAGVLILPTAVAASPSHPLALATGKVAILYLLDQTNLGGFNNNSNNDVQEVIPVPPPNTTQLDGGNYGLPAYWNGNIYSTGQNYPLSQFKIANGMISTPQSAQSTNMFPPRGATPSVSANGTANGIVWILDLSAWATNGSAILDAYDATNVSNLLYSGTAGLAVKFTVPTVANGKVYVGGQSVFTVFGLLPN